MNWIIERQSLILQNGYKMTVQDLIDLLETVPDKNTLVFAYACEDVDIEDPNYIDSIDMSIPNRVDLNIRAMQDADYEECWGAIGDQDGEWVNLT